MYVTQTPQTTADNKQHNLSGAGRVLQPAGYNAIHACRPPAEQEATLRMRGSVSALYWAVGSYLVRIRFFIGPCDVQSWASLLLCGTCMPQHVQQRCCRAILVGNRVWSRVPALSSVHPFLCCFCNMLSHFCCTAVFRVSRVKCFQKNKVSAALGFVCEKSASPCGATTKTCIHIPKKYDTTIKKIYKSHSVNSGCSTLFPFMFRPKKV